MYFPFSGVEFPLWYLLLIGFTVGVCGGFFGFGGGFMVTPSLAIFGFPYAFAAGTDLQHIAGKSIIATIRHRELGNVDFKLGLLLLAGTVPGVELGHTIVEYLKSIGKEVYMLLVCFIVLSCISGYMLYELSKVRRFIKEKGIIGKDVVPSKLPQRIQNIKVPPMILLQATKVTISLWIIIAIAFPVGLLAGLLGAGGGFIMVPSLIYIIGAPTTVAVGTDLFQVMFTAAYGGLTYALSGHVDILAAILMLAVAAVGAQIGSIATAYVRGISIRYLFSIMIFSAGLGALLRFIASPETYGIAVLQNVALVLVLGAALILCIVIIIYLAKGITAAREKQRKAEVKSQSTR
ncbi:MAG: sulfite exporter TauE/SafE family protein [Euryarchaeota archaeon]|nr:sulfite exporter TauE/SafE family protein [Euryarchaeota archaeon]